MSRLLIVISRWIWSTKLKKLSRTGAGSTRRRTVTLLRWIETFRKWKAHGRGNRWGIFYFEEEEQQREKLERWLMRISSNGHELHSSTKVLEFNLKIKINNLWETQCLCWNNISWYLLNRFTEPNGSDPWSLKDFESHSLYCSEYVLCKCRVQNVCAGVCMCVISLYCNRKSLNFCFETTDKTIGSA